MITLCMQNGSMFAECLQDIFIPYSVVITHCMQVFNKQPISQIKSHEMVARAESSGSYLAIIQPFCANISFSL